MKQNYQTINFILMTFIILTILFHIYDNTISYSLKTNDSIQTIGTYNADIEQKITKLYYNIPKKLRYMLNNHSLIVYVCDDLKSLFDNQNVIGMTEITNFGNKRIYISSKNIDETFYHEIGHAINYEYEHIATSTDFIKIYHLEKNNIPNNTFSFFDSLYASKSSHEYFAEAFNLYIQNEKACSQYLPATYKFLQENIFEGGKIHYGKHYTISSILRDSLFQQTTQQQYSSLRK